MSLPQLVLVKFKYEYETREGRQVSIKPNERYVLVAKTTDHWWYVRKDEATKPFYIPAQYVTVIPSGNETTRLSGEQHGQDALNYGVQDTTHSDPVPPVPLEVTIEDQIPTFLIPSDQYQSKSFENEPWEAKTEPGIDPCNLYKEAIQMDVSQDGSTNSFPHTPTSTLQETVTEIPPNENPSPTDLNEDIQMLIRAGWDPKIWDLKEDHIYDSVTQDNKGHERNVEVDLALVSPDSTSSMSPPFSPGFPIDIPPPFSDKVEDEDVYVNLPRARERISSLSSASAWGVSEPSGLHNTFLLGSRGWEVHTDEESGKEYYYHPSTGRSTWDFPL
ncbi:hypothetical protein QTP86_033936, partial [Hemibagrus guttatus]